MWSCGREKTPESLLLVPATILVKAKRPVKPKTGDGLQKLVFFIFLPSVRAKNARTGRRQADDRIWVRKAKTDESLTCTDKGGKRRRPMKQSEKFRESPHLLRDKALSLMPGRCPGRMKKVFTDRAPCEKRPLSLPAAQSRPHLTDSPPFLLPGPGRALPPVCLPRKERPYTDISKRARGRIMSGAGLSHILRFFILI